LPKNALDSALSAQICSLSENSAEFCLLAMTGACQLDWSATSSGVRPVSDEPSIRDTAIASSP
jgi:hypothetical protein